MQQDIRTLKQISCVWMIALCLCQLAKFEIAEAIHCRIIAFSLLIHYFTLLPWPLTFDLEHLQCITCWNSVPNLNAIEQSAAELLRAVFRGAWTQLYQTCWGRSSLHKKFVSVFRYPAAFPNSGDSQLSDVENNAKFRALWPPPPFWKIREEWARLFNNTNSWSTT